MSVRDCPRSPSLLLATFGLNIPVQRGSLPAIVSLATFQV